MATKSLYTKRLGRIVANRARPLGSKRYHLISAVTEGDKWALVADGNKTATRVFTSQKEAISYARQVGSRRILEVVVHEKTGQARNIISFAKA